MGPLEKLAGKELARPQSFLFLEGKTGLERQ
jgi:hypothetical protein